MDKISNKKYLEIRFYRDSGKIEIANRGSDSGWLGQQAYSSAGYDFTVCLEKNLEKAKKKFLEKKMKDVEKELKLVQRKKALIQVALKS
jgi:hypothetical protein